MKVVTVAGPPSVGKTSVIAAALSQIFQTPQVSQAGAAPKVAPKAVVAKFDCLACRDAEVYRARGIEARTGLSAGQCPDHFFATNAPDAFRWGASCGADLLVTESAGLCNRCSPYIEGVPALCVVDCLAGFEAPRKMGPLLRLADMVVLTKGDLVSQAEREVFAYRVQSLAPRAAVVGVNGLTGQGALRVARFFAEAPEVATLDERPLRYDAPSALCSYCLGERLLGEEHQMGNVRRWSEA